MKGLATIHKGYWISFDSPWGEVKLNFKQRKLINNRSLRRLTWWKHIWPNEGKNDSTVNRENTKWFKMKDVWMHHRSIWIKDDWSKDEEQILWRQKSLLLRHSWKNDFVLSLNFHICKMKLVMRPILELLSH